MISQIAKIDGRSEQPGRFTAYPRHHGSSRSNLVKHAGGRSRHRPGERRCTTAMLAAGAAGQLSVRPGGTVAAADAVRQCCTLAADSAEGTAGTNTSKGQEN